MFIFVHKIEKHLFMKNLVNFKNVLLATVIFTASSCSILQPNNSLSVDTFPKFSYEGHRGARGLHPENSIGAMKIAIDLPKVTTLEMDCHITKDKKVVVYHDHFLNPKFVQYNDGKELNEQDKKNLIYDYTYEELQNFDIGSKFYEAFPDQEKTPTTINLLSELIEASEKYALEKRTEPMFYNIEVKSKPGKELEYHPRVDEFADLMLGVIVDAGIAERTVIQSFDIKAIQHINQFYPQIKTSYLISSLGEKNLEDHIKDLGFTPFILSPNYKIVTKDLVKQAHKLGMKVIPWTVNDKKEIAQLKSLKVDGIISDYPNLF